MSDLLGELLDDFELAHLRPALDRLLMPSIPIGAAPARDDEDSSLEASAPIGSRTT